MPSFPEATANVDVMNTPVKRTEVAEDAERRTTAFHEAGHAVVSLYLGRAVQRVSIQANSLRLGICEFKGGRGRGEKDWLEAEAVVMLGGMVAEARHTGRMCEESALHDLRGVRALIGQRALGERQADRLERRFLDKTDYILDRPGVWDAVVRIAEELLAHTTISGRAAQHLYETAIARAHV